MADPVIQAALEKLEAERAARIQAKIDAGKAVRGGPLVVGVPDPKRDYAAVRRDAEGREVYPPEDCSAIFTGVPRAGRDDGLKVPTSEPCYPTSGVPQGKTKPPPAAEPFHIVEAGEWRYVRAVVRAPDPEKDDPGQLKEGWYRLEGDLLRVEDNQGRSLGTATIRPGDDIEVAAKKLLRESHGRHGAFYDVIKYPKGSYH